MKNDTLSFYRLVRDFLTVCLPKQRGASPNTAKSYKDTLNLFVDSREQRAKWLLADIWRLPRGSNTPPLGAFQI